MIKKSALIIICFFASTITLIAQTNGNESYKARAKEIQNEVWGNADTAFEVTKIPEKFRNESAVIIARSYIETVVPAITATFEKKQTPVQFITYHERVKINDKAALSNFSELSYNKKLSQTYKKWFKKKTVDIFKTYVGIKIYKPGIKEILVNTDEEVILNNESKGTNAKLAVPDLQTGDIVDYYVRIELFGVLPVMGPYYFLLSDEYPVMSYHCKFTLDIQSGVDVILANNARPIYENLYDNGHIVLEFTERDMAKNTNTVWSSPYRQLPYRVIQYSPFLSTHFIHGSIKHPPYIYEYRTYWKDKFSDIIKKGGVDFSVEKDLKSYYKTDKKNIPVDSVINFLYNYYRLKSYNIENKNEFVVDKDDLNETEDVYTSAVSCSELLADLDIKNTILFVCNRNNTSFINASNPGDFNVVIKVDYKGTLFWIGFNKFFQSPDQLDADFQGEEAYLIEKRIDSKVVKYFDPGIPVVLPVAKYSDNRLKEDIDIRFSLTDLQTIQLQRHAVSSGSMKFALQKKLLLAEDIEASLAQSTGKKKIVDRLSESKKTLSKSQELQAAFDKEKEKQKNYFTHEIKEQYGEEPKSIISYKIVNDGLSLANTSFEYDETFTMDNFIKKAGNNYIFEVGKLMGIYKRIEEKERLRTMDVYVPCAHERLFNFTINLPDGFTVKGISELNKKTENNISSFTSTATQKGNVITITTSLIYYNNFEPAGNWSKLLEVFDAAADFTTEKLLLQKKM